jgi:hypothetical protein
VEEWLPTLQRLIAAGLTLLLVMLRLEAERFNAAEYDEITEGRAPSFRRRIAWYVLGFGLVAAIFYVHPAAADELHFDPGERARTIIYGFLYAAIGTSLALAFMPVSRR